jgi:hypothetical protein
MKFLTYVHFDPINEINLKPQSVAIYNVSKAWLKMLKFGKKLEWFHVILLG